MAKKKVKIDQKHLRPYKKSWFWPFIPDICLISIIFFSYPSIRIEFIQSNWISNFVSIKCNVWVMKFFLSGVPRLIFFFKFKSNSDFYTFKFETVQIIFVTIVWLLFYSIFLFLISKDFLNLFQSIYRKHSFKVTVTLSAPHLVTCKFSRPLK